MLRCFAGIFTVAFAVRLVVVLLSGSEPRNDLLWNDAVGWNLANGHGFTASQHEPRIPGIFRTPGYPVFLALIYTFFGHSYRAAYIAQAVLDSGSAVLISMIALRLTSLPTAVLAGVLYAIYPYAAFFCGILHQDILLVFVTQTVLLLLLRVTGAGIGPQGWAAVGMVTGLAALVKANFLLLVALPALAIWSGVPRARRPAVATLALMLGVSAAIAPWVLRNYVTFHAFPPLAVGGTGTNLTLLLEELDHGEQHLVENMKSFETDATRYLETFLDGPALIAKERKLASAATAELARRWPDYLLLVTYNIPRLWLTRYSIGYSPSVRISAILLSWFVLALGLIGMWLARKDFPRNLPLYLVVIIVTVMYAPYTAEARYTLPARPAMLVFVAYALLTATNFGRAWRTRRQRGRCAAGTQPSGSPGNA